LQGTRGAEAASFAFFGPESGSPDPTAAAGSARRAEPAERLVERRAGRTIGIPQLNRPPGAGGSGKTPKFFRTKLLTHAEVMLSYT
jgi:hypothetical protein